MFWSSRLKGNLCVVRECVCVCALTLRVKALWYEVETQTQTDDWSQNVAVCLFELRPDHLEGEREKKKKTIRHLRKKKRNKALTLDTAVLFYCVVTDS